MEEKANGSKKKFLTEQQCLQFEEQGYLVLPNFWSRETVDALRHSIDGIIRNMDLESSRTIFTTKEQDRKTTSDAYFLGSGDKIRFFWEEDAFDEEGNFVDNDKSKCINKIGHALHDLNDEFKKWSYEDRMGMVCRDLGMAKPLAVQSMYIFKQPKFGGEVKPHQDGTFLYTEPQSVIGFWWALEDCSITNGCLWAVPGSHKDGVKRRFKRNATNTSVEFEGEAEQWSLDGAEVLEVPAGTLVILHSAVVHYSMVNSSDKSRHAYTLHVIEGEKSVKYPADNWLQREDGKNFNEIP